MRGPVGRDEFAAACRRLAEQGEAEAAEHLLANGYRIHERNWRAGRRGEIDIIAVDPQGILVFVEVKSRRAGACLDAAALADAFQMGLAAVNYAKQRKLSAAARKYVAERRIWNAACRFDVIAVALDSARLGDPQRIPTLVHVVDAFRLV